MERRSPRSAVRVWRAFAASVLGALSGIAADAAHSEPRQASFDGAAYATEAEKVLHGRRVAELLGCNTCHLEDYTGTDFGAVAPIVEGLYATNISLTMPGMSDAELERLLRTGVHPKRKEIYLMPSKQSQFLSEADMAALIAFLRTVEPAGEPTPNPPPGFEEAVTARLPDDYWIDPAEDGTREYHNAEQEAAYFADNRVPHLGDDVEQGRYIATAICSSCHGAALDGIGEPAGNIQAALDYTDEELDRLLAEGVDRHGREIEMNWGSNHAQSLLTAGERSAVSRYTKSLAIHRKNTRP